MYLYSFVLLQYRICQPSNKEVSIISVFTEGKWRLAVCLCTAFQAWTRSCLCGGNAIREASALALHCRNSNTVYMSWACHPCSRSGGCFHVNHILAPSQNPVLPLGSYITTCVFLDEPWGGLLEGHILSQALQNTGQKEQSEPSAALCLAPQWEWQRGWQHMNSSSCGTVLHSWPQRCRSRNGWHLLHHSWTCISLHPELCSEILIQSTCIKLYVEQN